VSDLVWKSARSLARAIAQRELSAAELMGACYDQIERLNPQLKIVGRPRGDFELLQIAYGFEQATRNHLRRPGIAAATDQAGPVRARLRQDRSSF
jgi:Asp-tRNA(Asn)/Glu-tRNA(Gln) amidotransferase A subunit family amidase